MSQCDICAKPGRCCRGFILSDSRGELTHWDDEGPVGVLQDLDARGLAMFYPVLKLSTYPSDPAPGDRAYSVYRYACHWLGPDGRCLSYATRPQVCRSYEPAQDPLCLYHNPQPAEERTILLKELPYVRTTDQTSA